MGRENAVMARAGYIPAARVAEALDKSLMTIHRMVEDGDVEGVKDGGILHIKWESLLKHYEGNEPMTDAVMLLEPFPSKPKKRRA
jgi:hypothetical protein